MFNKKNKFPIHIIFCFVDHFEPKWEKPSKDIENARVEAWLQKYPVITNSHMDSDGKRPQHTWFYPAEEYEYDCEEVRFHCLKFLIVNREIVTRWLRAIGWPVSFLVIRFQIVVQTVDNRLAGVHPQFLKNRHQFFAKSAKHFR